MFSANTPARPNRIPGTLDLEISDPVLMLNEIARRYETTERVLMEYVDNALDDAEVLFRENNNRYPYPIKIEVAIDFDARTVTIKDNCRGMSRQLLERVVKNIGESQKRGVTWVNGRFGFGVQAFRAAADTVEFQTKHQTSSGYTLKLHRSQHHGIKEAKRFDDPFPTDSGTGTIVSIIGFDANWSDFSVESIKTEIENHFERLMARSNLTITVSEIGQLPVQCLPFDYKRIEGESIQQTFRVNHKAETYPIDVHLTVARQKIPNRAASFFVRGRRINDAVQIKSFIRKSKYKTGLWGHPNLLGYIEVGEIVQPAITRDDFNRTKGRQVCYETILTLEPEINKLLRQVNKAGKDQTLVAFANVVNEAVAGKTHEKERPSLGIIMPALATDPKIKSDQSLATPTRTSNSVKMFNKLTIQFVSELPGSAGSDKRACQVDDTICINIEHPDFQERLATTRQGGLKITDRLNSYLASIISVYRLKQADPTRPNTEDVIAILEAQVDAVIKLEAILHKQRSALVQALSKQ